MSDKTIDYSALIDAVVNDDQEELGSQFSDILDQKKDECLGQHRIAMAQAVFDSVAAEDNSEG